MAFLDLYVKWRSDKTEKTRQARLQELMNESEYEVVLNFSLHQKPFPVFSDNPATKARLTIKANFSQLLNDTESLARYDLIAARPVTDADFHYCCITGEVDVISLKMHERLTMKVKLNLVQEAIKRGIMFEICYAHALRDLNSRRTFIANASSLVKATKGRNIIMSSGAKDLFEQRAPWDVINLACVLGLPVDVAHRVVVENPAIALEHGRARKVFKSAVQVVSRDVFAKEAGEEKMPLI
jgi:ribonuclease P/MRP protein subunit RPP1